MKRSAAVLLAALLLIAPARGSDGVVVHTVRPGETLTSIARTCGTTTDAMREANPGVDERSLMPGATLRLPASERWLKHTVARGETLFALARRYGASVEEIQGASRLEGTQLEVGMVVIVPRVSEPPIAAPTDAPPLQGVPPLQASPAAQPSPAASAPQAGASAASSPRWVEVRLKDGRRAWAPYSAMIVSSPAPAAPPQVVDIARQFTGAPYRWGGETPNGADCSGFVEEVFRLGGYTLPRTADVQFTATVAVPQEAIQVGDLVFFTTYEPGPSHVGIYVGDGRFIHASSSRGVTESRLDETYYAKRYLGARRIAQWPAPPPPVAAPTSPSTVQPSGTEPSTTPPPPRAASRPTSAPAPRPSSPPRSTPASGAAEPEPWNGYEPSPSPP